MRYFHFSKDNYRRAFRGPLASCNSFRWNNVDSLENWEFSSHAFFPRCYFPCEFFSRHAFPRYTIPRRKLSRREFLVTHSPGANLLCHGFLRKCSRPAFSRLIFFRRVFHRSNFSRRAPPFIPHIFTLSSSSRVFLLLASLLFSSLLAFTQFRPARAFSLLSRKSSRHALNFSRYIDFFYARARRSLLVAYFFVALSPVASVFIITESLLSRK